jgi:hypothetical protein
VPGGASGGVVVGCGGGLLAPRGEVVLYLPVLDLEPLQGVAPEVEVCGRLLGGSGLDDEGGALDGVAELGVVGTRSGFRTASTELLPSVRAARAISAPIPREAPVTNHAAMGKSLSLLPLVGDFLLTYSSVPVGCGAMKAVLFLGVPHPERRGDPENR